ncbi:CatB-related O-acetyltransferase [Limosilactobacillus sp.]|jgi:virginiamycin A acetyltransferase|uniref:CatB-related O-acetyltransferase n=1 Tax=Limosilactobacillus sp. TaxID=2773925 RepID=UPI0025C0E291|nr:DapH/DapD/GlmU-related protein [Limosilactobacillus sp.]MCH3923248.1 acetyltransferase [Limosilactobacillus sp.]MCH3927930.1 acetyltransferase [Limosilactobacillus sp.]
MANKYSETTLMLSGIDLPTNVHVGEHSYYSLARDEEPAKFSQNHILYNNPRDTYQLRIGKFCAIATGVEFLMASANHSIKSISTYPFNTFSPEWRELTQVSRQDLKRNDTVIGNDVWIGRKATIMPGVTVGDGAIIGAQAVVTKNVAPYTVVGGNPAKLIRSRFDDETIAKLEQIKWWSFPDELLDRIIPLLTTLDVEEAIVKLAEIKEKLDESN